MPLDFKVTGADDGYNNEDSIEPYDNGEAAEQSIFRRPPENLRSRTEVVRKAVDDAFLVNSADRGWLLIAAEGTQATWNGTVAGGGGGDGKWALNSGAIFLMPIISASGEKYRNDIRARLSYKIGTDSYFTVRSLSEAGGEIRAYNGANNLKIELFKEVGVTFLPSDTPEVTVVGSTDDGGTTHDPGLGPVLIRVQLSYDTQVRSTWGQVCTQINGHTDAGQLVHADVDASGTGQYAVEIAEQFLWQGLGTDVSGVGAIDAQAIQLPKSQIDTFFSTGGGSAGMADGNAVVVEFDTARDRLDQSGDVFAGAALRLIHRNESDDPNDGEFSSVGNAFKGNSIPLCKVLNNELWFVNGVVLKKDQTVAIRQNDAQLREDLADNDTSTGTCGAELIGSDEISGSPRSLPDASTVYGQLGAMLGFYNNHVSGTADEHPIKDITTRPFVIVDPSGNGDYTDLASAWNTVRNTGGIIYMKPGQYDDQVLSTTSRSITVIGESNASANGVRIRGVSGEALEIADPNATIIFKNIFFNQEADANGLLIYGEPYVQEPVIFEDCIFYKNPGAPNSTNMVDTSVHTVFRRCAFIGDATTDGSAAIQAASSAGLGATFVTVEHCHFYLWGRVLEYGRASGGLDEHERLIFRDNLIETCGHSPSTTDVYYLIDRPDLATAYWNWVDISDNIYKNSGTADQIGLFCKIEAGGGRISNNSSRRALVKAVTAELYVIYAKGRGASPSAAQPLLVADNIFEAHDLAGAIHLDGFANARGNVCRGFDPNGSSTANVIKCTGDCNTVSENKIYPDNTNLNTTPIIYATGNPDHLKIVNNDIFDAYRSVGGIKVANSAEIHHVIISGNTIQFRDDAGNSYDCIGIFVAGAGGVNYIGECVINGNTIEDAARGIVLEGVEHFAVVGNTIHWPVETTQECRGISTNADCLDGTIASNTITHPSDSNGNTYGIYVDDSSRLVVSGNAMFHVFHGIHNPNPPAGNNNVFANNNINLTDNANAVGIYCNSSSGINAYMSIIGNLIRAINTSSDGIDVTNCSKLGMGGNVLVPHQGFSAGNYFVVTGATNVGMSKDPVTGTDVDAKNYYTTV